MTCTERENSIVLMGALQPLAGNGLANGRITKHEFIQNAKESIRMSVAGVKERPILEVSTLVGISGQAQRGES